MNKIIRYVGIALTNQYITFFFRKYMREKIVSLNTNRSRH